MARNCGSRMAEDGRGWPVADATVDPHQRVTDLPRETAGMPTETVVRRWTVATWLVAGMSDQLEMVTQAIDAADVDAVALQSLRRDDAETIGTALGMRVAWELSHYPVTRLFPGSGVGLAVLTPHTITSSHAVVTNEHRSTWSSKRRIAQFAVVERHDQTVYAIGHAVGPTNGVRSPAGSFPLVAMTPEQVGVDSNRAITLPDGATLVGSQVTRPADDRAHLQVTTFEMPWVRGDFPVI